MDTAEMRALEAAAVASGVPEEALMDEAGAGLAAVVRRFFPQPGAAVVFAGKGHNAGDACVLAARLLEAGWTVEFRMAWPGDAWRPLARRKLEGVRDRVTFAALESEEVPSGRPLLLIDGLLGIGAGGGLKSPVREACRTINHLRERHFAEVLAVDVPTGMNADNGAVDEDAVRADLTVTLGFPKTGLCAPGAEKHAGRLALVPLTALPCPENAGGRDRILTPSSLRHLIHPRSFSMHKGQAGRVGIVAGSRGLTGAARLASAAAGAAGGGLVTLFCPADVHEVLAASCPPEVMVRPVNSYLEVMDFPLDAIGVGPGIGPVPLPHLASLLREDPRPVIVDADALNVMAVCGVSLKGRKGGPRLLTPHPGELARLEAAFVPGSPDAAKALAEAWDVTVLAKGSRSRVVATGQPVCFNTTGHPMMAKGGMGDVLTGFCSTFAAQGMSLYDAAGLGSWLLGYAAEQARLVDSDAPEGFTPSRLIELA
ncbi:MAG TPA: NAD(P)H-hydrate dehydratase, partial [Verrucomicrobiales bacterium]|nr:NAD(P)H-hydrate dehydratase [Verrucomicrobiales bacterium]